MESDRCPHVPAAVPAPRDRSHAGSVSCSRDAGGEGSGSRHPEDPAVRASRLTAHPTAAYASLGAPNLVHLLWPPKPTSRASRSPPPATDPAGNLACDGAYLA